jgi:hypothetical protein
MGKKLLTLWLLAIAIISANANTSVDGTGSPEAHGTGTSSTITEFAEKNSDPTTPKEADDSKGHIPHLTKSFLYGSERNRRHSNEALEALVLQIVQLNRARSLGQMPKTQPIGLGGHEGGEPSSAITESDKKGSEKIILKNSVLTAPHTPQAQHILPPQQQPLRIVEIRDYLGSPEMALMGARYMAMSADVLNCCPWQTTRPTDESCSYPPDHQFAIVKYVQGPMSHTRQIIPSTSDEFIAPRLYGDWNGRRQPTETAPTGEPYSYPPGRRLANAKYVRKKASRNRARFQSLICGFEPIRGVTTRSSESFYLNCTPEEFWPCGENLQKDKQDSLPAESSSSLQDPGDNILLSAPPASGTLLRLMKRDTRNRSGKSTDYGGFRTQPEDYSLTSDKWLRFWRAETRWTKKNYGFDICDWPDQSLSFSIPRISYDFAVNAARSPKSDVKKQIVDIDHITRFVLDEAGWPLGTFQPITPPKSDRTEEEEPSSAGSRSLTGFSSSRASGKKRSATYVDYNTLAITDKDGVLLGYLKR